MSIANTALLDLSFALALPANIRNSDLKGETISSAISRLCIQEQRLQGKVRLVLLSHVKPTSKDTRNRGVRRSMRYEGYEEYENGR